MAIRESISKKIRFEIYKRDKFTCQYCGRKAPDIVLNIDHIDPIAKGGNNDIINLITSCFDCNNGKSDRKLDDNSVIEKQRKQLEILQDRREQIELMLEWKKSLADFDNDVIDMIGDYVDGKIKPYSLNEKGKKTVSDWIKKFTTEKILDGIDEAAKQYLKYENGEISKESAEVFLSKIGGVIVNRAKPPIERKLAYIKGIARNKFAFWDDKKGMIILKNYINALKRQDWSEDDILDDLEKELMPLTKNANNWSQWRNSIEGWINDINQWEKPIDKNEQGTSLNEDEYISIDDLQIHAGYSISCAIDRSNALIHIGSAFPGFDDQKFSEELDLSILQFLNLLETLYKAAVDNEVEEDPEFITNFITNNSLTEYFLPSIEFSGDYGMLYFLSEKSKELIKDIFNEFYLPKMSYSRKDSNDMLDLYLKYYNERGESSWQSAARDELSGDPLEDTDTDDLPF